jgi:hypothetical protein
MGYYHQIVIIFKNDPSFTKKGMNLSFTLTCDICLTERCVVNMFWICILLSEHCFLEVKINPGTEFIDDCPRLGYKMFTRANSMGSSGVHGTYQNHRTSLVLY